MIQMSLSDRAASSECFLGAFWIANNAFYHAGNEDCNQTARMHTDLCLRWTHMSDGTFSYVAAQFYFSLKELRKM